MRRLPLILVLAGAILALSLALGCGGDNGPTGPASKQVSGLVTKAPVSGAIVSVFAINTNGRPGARAAGPVNTASDGTWTLSVPTNQGDDLLVVSAGGAYTDEATGHAESFRGVDQLTGRLDLRSDAPFVVVSPFTQALDGAARARIATGTGVREAWDDVTAEMLLALGFDATRTIPAIGDGATDGQERYAAFLGGISPWSTTTPYSPRRSPSPAWGRSSCSWPTTFRTGSWTPEMRRATPSVARFPREPTRASRGSTRRA